MTAIRLYRHNRNDGGWEISAAELAERYVASMRSRGGRVFTLAAFIQADESDGGLASAVDDDTYSVLDDEVWPLVDELWSR